MQINTCTLLPLPDFFIVNRDFQAADQEAEVVGSDVELGGSLEESSTNFSIVLSIQCTAHYAL